MEFERKEFANRIIKARESKQLKQVELANMAGVTQNTVYNLEKAGADRKNFCQVPISSVFKIAEVLGVSIDYLCSKDKVNNCISINTDEVAERIVNKFADTFEFRAISCKEISNCCGINEYNLLKLKKLVNSGKTTELQLINRIISNI